MTNLAIDNRPTKFSEVLGQDGVRWMLATLLIKSQQGEPFPPAVLLSGPSGVGKTSLARIVGRALNCSEPVAEEPGEPCLQCPSCEQSLRPGHPAIVEIDAANFASADEARELVVKVASAHPFNHMVLVLDECHAMSRQAWDVLLRTIEACPPAVTFVFCTTSPERLRPEVLSRVYRFDLSAPKRAAVAGRLQSVAAAQGHEVPPGVCFDLAYRSRGNIRTAYQLLEQVLLHPSYDVQALLGPSRFGLSLVEVALQRDRLAGVRLLDEAWYRVGSVSEIYADWMGALEDLLQFKFGVLDDDDEAVLGRYREIASGYHETMIAAGMETISDWARRGGRRASLSFAWTEFLKAIGGPTVVDSSAVGAARKHARKATAADLSNFTL